MSKVQIVIPAINLWNSYTRACIESIKTKHEYRILLIDNASTDETRVEAEKMVSDRFSHKRNEERWACAKSWNYGVRDAFDRGFEYVLVLNNDVILHPDAIDSLVERFEVFNAPEIIDPIKSLAMVTCLDMRGESVEGNTERPDKMLSFNKDDVPETEHPCFSGFMINKQCWEKVGEFDEGFAPAYFEDNDYHNRINLAGMKAIVYPPAMFYHYGSKTTTEGLKPDPETHKRFEANRSYYVGKWGGQPGREGYKTPFNNPNFSLKGTKQNNYV